MRQRQKESKRRLKGTETTKDTDGRVEAKRERERKRRLKGTETMRETDEERVQRKPFSRYAYMVWRDPNDVAREEEVMKRGGGGEGRRGGGGGDNSGRRRRKRKSSRKISQVRLTGSE